MYLVTKKKPYPIQRDIRRPNEPTTNHRGRKETLRPNRRLR